MALIPITGGHRPTVAPRYPDRAGRRAGIYSAHAFRVLGFDGLCADRRDCRWHGIDACLPTDALRHLVSREPEIGLSARKLLFIERPRSVGLKMLRPGIKIFPEMAVR